jgi:hypothetical protein
MGTLEKRVVIEERVLALMEFVETGVFQKAWKTLGCSEGDLRQLQIQLINNPDAGPVIQGTGGARKMRFARESSHHGQSGDLRVIYTRFPAFKSIALVFAYHKNDQENLTDADKRVIKDLIDQISSVLPIRPNTAKAKVAKAKPAAKAAKAKKTTKTQKGKR